MSAENSPLSGSLGIKKPPFHTASTGGLKRPWTQRSLSELFTDIPWRLIGRWIVASNPFYLLSALLMLQGIYMVSIDPQMFGQEQSQLAFNFSSLQIYELLLVLTALFLARHQLWHDTALLFWLENLFVFVPFILISQASMLENRGIWTWTLCLTATLFTSLRFTGWKYCLRSLILPPAVLLLGAALLVTNLVFPLYFREVIGRDSLAWSELSPKLWLWVLPAFVWAAVWFPRNSSTARRSLNRTWTPLAAYAIWTLATAVHLRCVDYLDGIRFNVSTLAALLWSAAWVFHLCLDRFVLPTNANLTRSLCLPLFTTALALGRPNSDLFLCLTALNCLLLGWMILRNRQDRTAREFLYVSAAALLAAMPEHLGNFAVPDFSREKLIILSIGAYLLWQSCRSRKAQGALIGSVITGLGTQYLLSHFDYSEQLALQNALLFGLAHSLFRIDSQKPAARAVWKAFAIALPIHSFVWGRIAGLDAALMILFGGLFLAGIYYLARLISGSWQSKLFVASAGTSILGIGVNHTIEVLRITPTGYLLVLGAFATFACGTAYALTRERWLSPHKNTLGEPPANISPVTH